MEYIPARVEAAFARHVDDMTDAAQQSLHLARPIRLFDCDQSLQFPQMMGVARIRPAAIRECPYESASTAFGC